MRGLAVGEQNGVYYFGVLAAGGFEGVMMIERLGVREGEGDLTPEQIDERAVQAIQFLTPLLERHFGNPAGPSAPP